MKLSFYNTRTLRAKLNKQQKKRISQFYYEVAKIVKRRAEGLKGFNNVSSVVKRKQMDSILEEINQNIEMINKEIELEITKNIRDISIQSIKDNANFANKMGFEIQPNIAYFSDEMVRRVISGRLYESNWTLSKAIWGENKKVREDIESIVAKGITMNRSSYDIAKDLERYVNPKARKDWKWSNYYPGTNKMVDYNAQRLATTIVSHAYQQALVMNTKYNPFVVGLRWLASNSNRVCPLCLDREGKIYKSEELPLDHPNGMCTFEAVIEKDMTEISNRIAEWYKGKSDPALDKYSKFLRGEQPLVNYKSKIK